MSTAAATRALYPAASPEKMLNCLFPSSQKALTDWAVDLLDIRPYQHILEIGYASGLALKEVARELKIGFVAGIDESVSMFRQAYRRNKKSVHDQVMQLHIGQIHELPYPHHYFHSIYGINILSPGRPAENTILQLSGLLRSGGRMLMLWQPPGASTEEEVYEAAEQLRLHYTQAGLSRIETAFRDMHPVTCIAITGYRC